MQQTTLQSTKHGNDDDDDDDDDDEVCIKDVAVNTNINPTLTVTIIQNNMIYS